MNMLDRLLARFKDSSLKKSIRTGSPHAQTNSIQVNFINNSQDDNVSIFWLDFNGQEVEYFRNVKPNER